MSRSHFWCFILILFTFMEVSSEHIPTVVIRPEKVYCDQKLYNGQSVYYHLQNLEQETDYELRISYRAGVPTEFVFKDVTVPKLFATGRKLMNIDKLTFSTELQEQEKYIEVTAFRVGRPVRTSLIEEGVVYNIILERLYAGLPWNVWKVVVLILLFVLVVIFFCLPWIRNYMDYAMEKME